MKTIKISVLLFTLLSFPLLCYAESKPSIYSWTVKSNSDKGCSGKGTYLGPNNTNDHWGTCVKVNGIKVLSEYTLKRSNCHKTGWVYVGPNRAHEHGGYCAKLNSKKWALKAKEERHSKSCGRNSVYAGANNVKAHWGHCLSVVATGWKPDKRINDKEAVERSDRWVERKRKRERAARKAEVQARQDRINKRLAEKGKPKSNASSFVSFDNWNGLKANSPCDQNSKNRIAKFVKNETDSFIKVKVYYKKWHSSSGRSKSYYRIRTLSGNEREFLACVDHLNQTSPRAGSVWNKSGQKISE